MFSRRPQPALKTHIEDPQNFRMKIFNSLSMKASARVEVQRASSCYGQPSNLTNQPPNQPTNQPSGNHQIWPRSISAHLYLCLYGYIQVRHPMFTCICVFVFLYGYFQVYYIDIYRWDQIFILSNFVFSLIVLCVPDSNVACTYYSGWRVWSLI